MAHKILIVDDDEDIKFLLKTALQKEGYEVITAANGEQGLKAIATHVLDLMIVDLTMPVMNGWYFNMKVRENALYKTTPILVVSGLLEKEEKQEDVQANTYYMPKPFDVFNLTDKIKELLKDPSQDHG